MQPSGAWARAASGVGSAGGERAPLGTRLPGPLRQGSRTRRPRAEHGPWKGAASRVGRTPQRAGPATHLSSHPFAPPGSRFLHHSGRESGRLSRRINGRYSNSSAGSATQFPTDAGHRCCGLCSSQLYFGFVPQISLPQDSRFWVCRSTPHHTQQTCVTDRHVHATCRARHTRAS